MSGPGKHYRGYRRDSSHSHHTLSSITQDTAISLSRNSTVLDIFKKAALKLNERQDRHERLVKLSRDLTIESKRIIFLLHSSVKKDSTEETLAAAKERIQNLINGPIKSIGLELEHCPAYLHSRAVAAGIQEFIEARALFSVMSKGNIITYPEVQKEFVFAIMDDDPRTVVTMLPEIDYMSGLADLTGELMRNAINSISSGDTRDCFHTCQIVRDLYTGYLGITGACRVLIRKLPTTRTNVSKVEMAVYAVRVRGGEAPAPLLLAPAGPPEPEPERPDWEAPPPFADDEGYY